MAGLIMLTICAVVTAILLAWKLRKLQHAVYSFADQFEQALDCILSEKEVIGLEEIEDTLWGRISGKLQRVAHVSKQKIQKYGKRNSKSKNWFPTFPIRPKRRLPI